MNRSARGEEIWSSVFSRLLRRSVVTPFRLIRLIRVDQFELSSVELPEAGELPEAVELPRLWSFPRLPSFPSLWSVGRQGKIMHCSYYRLPSTGYRLRYG